MSWGRPWARYASTARPEPSSVSSPSTRPRMRFSTPRICPRMCSSSTGRPTPTRRRRRSSDGFARPICRPYRPSTMRPPVLERPSASSWTARRSGTKVALSRTSSPAPRPAIPTSCPHSAGCPGKTQWRMRIAARKPSSCATTTPRLVKSMSISAISRRPVMPSKKPVSRTVRSSVFPLHSVTTPDLVP